MRSTRWLVVLIAATATAAASLSMSCERETATDSNPYAAPTTSSARTGAAAPATSARCRRPRKSSARRPAAATRAAARLAANDPLATPDSAIAHMFDLMQKQDVTGVRAMMADPLPSEQLRGQVSDVADRLNSGAKWQIVDRRIEGAAAVVIFRTTFADGKEELAPLVLVNRYDRWKVMLGPLNLHKFTVGEKEQLSKVMGWAGKRLDELRGVTTKPATQEATSTPSVKP